MFNTNCCVVLWKKLTLHTSTFSCAFMHVCIWRKWICLVILSSYGCTVSLSHPFLIFSGSSRGFKTKIAVLIPSRPFQLFFVLLVASVSHKPTLSAFHRTSWSSLKEEQRRTRWPAQRRTRRDVKKGGGSFLFPRLSLSLSLSLTHT